MTLLSRVLALLSSTLGLVAAGVAHGQAAGRPSRAVVPLARVVIQQKAAVPVAPSSSTLTSIPGPPTTTPPVNQAQFLRRRNAGQTPPPGNVELPKSVFASETTSNPEDAAKQAARLQKIQQANFDRRPSTILRVWASLGEGISGAQPDAQPAPEPATPEKGPDGKTPEADPFDEELIALQKTVTLGKWDVLKSELAKLPEDEGKACYGRILETLPMPAMPGQMPTPPGMPQQPPVNPQGMEQNAIANGDVIALAQAAPHGRDDATLASLGRLLTTATGQGHTLADFLARARTATTEPAASPALPARDIAKILHAAGQATRMAEFLPEPAQAEAEGDSEALNLLATHYLAVHAENKKTAPLEKAWGVIQASLANASLAGKSKDESLRLAVELAPQIRAELGQRWLDQSFEQRPERGQEILAVIGTATAQGLQTRPMDATFRQKSLDLQKTAVDALLRAAPERADEWRETLELLSKGWLAEAEFSQVFDTSTSLGPQMQRDAYGNIFFGGNPNAMFMQQQQQNMPQAIPVGKLLPARPGPDWLARLSTSLQPKFDEILAELYLKVNEEGEAFPCIERLAAKNPETAKHLAGEFLRVWTENHDPNAAQNRTNPYMFMFGFERRAEGIPLTRSKQERNLKELAEWVHRLRSLPLGNLDEALVARAFTACHSSSEVYRLDAIESVFGSFETLKPETLAALAQQMRGNLASVWRMPAEQEKHKTNRREKDLRAEVLRGYDLARAVIDRGLEKFPDAWSLVLARGAILHDESTYRQEIEPGPDFTQRRQAAFADFEKAARLYAAKVPDLSQDEETTEPFETWFYAALGSCDLAQVQEKQLVDRRQARRIKEVLDGLPGEAGQRHRERFANGLFIRMSAANPAVKYRYLENGFAIVGDNPRAHESKKVFDYYKDLVTEIQLVTAIDGGDVVGHEAPFGVFVNLRHTRDLERESGGFGRYLQNQNAGAGTMFFYNYGRPLENYRDKFEEAARGALQEQFEVLSVTFQVETVHSRAAEPYGWRETPYAYLLLKARSPKVDTLPPLRLDLDFLDTSGYVVLPIESAVLPIDAWSTEPAPRPFRDLKVTQTLDERQAAEGKLTLEVKATALGLVPDLKSILNIPPRGFELADIEDKGVAVSRFDPDSPENAIASERQWLVALRADPAAEPPPQAFRFPPPAVEAAAVTYQRYNDADLEEVQGEVPLARAPVRPTYSWLGWTLGALALGAGAIALAWRFKPRRAKAEARRFAVPESVTPFSVLGLLRSIEQNDGLSPSSKGELASTIDRLERHYFLAPDSHEPDLRAIAETWARRAN